MLFENEEYIVTEQTMALLSIIHKTYRTKVLELNNDFMIKSRPLNVIDSSCLNYGSSYDGRRKAAKRLANLHFKAPVAIAPHKNIYAFPTHSSRKYECCWIFPRHVKDIAESKGDRNKSVILFTNLKEIQVNMSYFMLEKQLHRTAYCMMRLSWF